MSFIERKYHLYCSHPKVMAIWETGSLSAEDKNALMRYQIHFVLSDDSRKDFDGEDVKKVVQDAEEFLSSL